MELESTQVGSNPDPSPRPPIHVGSEATRVKSCKSQRDCFAARLKKAYKQAMSKWEDEYECPACRFHLGLLLRPQRPPERSAGSTGWNGNLGVVLFTSFHHPNVMIYDDFLPTFHKIHSMFLHSMLLRCCVAPYTVGYTERCPTSHHRSTLRLCRPQCGGHLIHLMDSRMWPGILQHFTTFTGLRSFTCQILMIFRE